MGSKQWVEITRIPLTLGQISVSDRCGTETLVVCIKGMSWVKVTSWLMPYLLMKIFNGDLSSFFFEIIKNGILYYEFFLNLNLAVTPYSLRLANTLSPLRHWTSSAVPSFSSWIAANTLRTLRKAGYSVMEMRHRFVSVTFKNAHFYRSCSLTVTVVLILFFSFSFLSHDGEKEVQKRQQPST